MSGERFWFGDLNYEHKTVVHYIILLIEILERTLNMLSHSIISKIKKLRNVKVYFLDLTKGFFMSFIV
jgi:hypothetical protein